MINQEDILYGKITVSGKPIISDETYEGNYEVTPKVTSQTLLTGQRVMKDNLNVLSIPYYETSNLKGKTIIIGEV